MIYRMGAPEPERCRTCGGRGLGCDDCNGTGLQGNPLWLIPFAVLCALFWALVVYFWM